jgi:hypothetical protein
MKHKKDIAKYDLQPGELDRFELFLKEKGFKVDECPPFRFEFTEASSILDTKAKDAYCGRIINYPWGFENKGLHVFKGTRLENAIKEYLKNSD